MTPLLRLLLILGTLAALAACGLGKQSDTEYWEERARRHGARSVFNLGHSEEELEEVTRYQMSVLFPILQRHLTGREEVVLDFGSGPGRFTPALAELIDGRAIGVDVVQHLLDIAPRTDRVEYRLIRNGSIPLPDSSVDVVWVTLVLGVITDDEALRQSVSEIQRVLRPGGLLFVVENTAERDDMTHFRFRPVEFYASLFPAVPLRHEGDYYDLGERISIFAGRKQAPTQP